MICMVVGTRVCLVSHQQRCRRRRVRLRHLPPPTPLSMAPAADGAGGRPPVLSSSLLPPGPCAEVTALGRGVVRTGGRRGVGQGRRRLQGDCQGVPRWRCAVDLAPAHLRRRWWRGRPPPARPVAMPTRRGGAVFPLPVRQRCTLPALAPRRLRRGRPGGNVKSRARGACPTAAAALVRGPPAWVVLGRSQCLLRRHHCGTWYHEIAGKYPP